MSGLRRGKINHSLPGNRLQNEAKIQPNPNHRPPGSVGVRPSPPPAEPSASMLHAPCHLAAHIRPLQIQPPRPSCSPSALACRLAFSTLKTLRAPVASRTHPKSSGHPAPSSLSPECPMTGGTQQNVCPLRCQGSNSSQLLRR